MARERPDYFSYLLRLWRARERGASAWRASLQDPHTGERMGFSSLGELLAFLREQMGLERDADQEID